MTGEGPRRRAGINDCAIQRDRNSAPAMSAIDVRNIPEQVRAASDTPTGQARRGGIDFDKRAADRLAAGPVGKAATWTKAMDDPAVSRRLLGL